MAEWIVKPDVSFRRDSFMMVGNRPLETDDISPRYLRDVIDISAEALHARIEYLNERDRTPHSRKIPRSHILVARLALAEREHDVLRSTPITLALRQTFHEYPDDLERIARGYWGAVSETDFSPIVQSHIMIGDPQIDGTWIGIREHTNT
jgi:hypothetical protein